MSYLADRLQGFALALLILAIYVGLPSGLRKHWGDAAFVALMCCGVTLSTSPETYFRRRIRALGKPRLRNLAANWTGLLASTGVAAAFAQHESKTGRMILWRHGQYLPLAIVLGPLIFLITYFVLWFAYRVFSSSNRYLNRGMSKENRDYTHQSLDQ